MDTTPRKTKLVLIVIALLLFGWIVLAIWQQLTFHIVSTSPSVDRVSTISPYFKITFSQPVTKAGLQVKVSPDASVGAPSVSGKVLTLPFNTPLRSGRTYTITLVSIRSAKGKTIADRTFIFKPTYIASSDLPEDQKRAILQNENIGGTANTKDPILARLPYQTTDFLLEQDVTPQKNPPKDLALNATLILAQADMGDEDGAVAARKQEVLNYITSLGLDPSKYSITYIVQTP